MRQNLSYQVFEQRAQRSIPPIVRINAWGALRLNAAAARLFRGQNRVVFLADAGYLAIKPVPKEHEDAFCLSYGSAGAAVSARSYLRSIGWDGRPHKMSAKWNQAAGLLECQAPRW